ncbi:hypothetical protein Acor_15250 [Acrocarpospora corrugata]|uniref:DUF998 domain-containing protein n=1 Tax=Acrocarpospora corrugata TaxID=35763 RepID=A0A5M3VUV7_9ACTN|nr:DUF998 domain-containing protein [Acrocarpospora corrugata]GER99461.1 hypothetical protein Acor_15250 [Acrocarpospora corrugata]
MTQQVTCDPRTSLTKSLLGYGVIAGPVYVTVGLAQALTREGFDLARHPWSFLANGDLGWIQIVNFVVAGLACVAAAVGFGRAVGGWASWLIGVYGVSLVGAAIFRADPALGFPVGTPDGPGVVTWHGTMHFVCGAVGFLAMIAACVILARRFAAEGSTGWAAYSATTGIVFLLAFGSVAAGGGAAWANVAFLAGILIIWGWLSAVSAHLYRRL